MNKPRFKYLTNAYVEWLGLEPTTIYIEPSAVAGWVSEDAVKPQSAESPFKVGVRFEDRTYIRQPDGLSWDLI